MPEQCDWCGRPAKWMLYYYVSCKRHLPKVKRVVKRLKGYEVDAGEDFKPKRIVEFRD